MTITATPKLLLSQDEMDFILSEISEELETLQDRRRGGDEEASEIEDALEEYSSELGQCQENKDGLYEIKDLVEFKNWVPEILDNAFDFYEGSKDDEEFINAVEWDADSYKEMLDNLEIKIFA